MSLTALPIDSTGEYTPTVGWRPNFYPGHMFSDDRRYFLYADKQTQLLEELAWHTFELQAPPADGVVDSVDLDGITLDPDDYVVEGDEIHVRHRGATGSLLNLLTDPWVYEPNPVDHNPHVLASPTDSVVSVEYTYQTWVPGTGTNPGSYSDVGATGEFALEDGTRALYLPDPIYLGHPVVITDDCIEYWDQRDFSVEFSISRDLTEGRGYRVELNQNENLLHNPVFRYYEASGDPGLPAAWSRSGTAFRREADAYVGTHVVTLAPTGEVYQTADIDGELDYSLTVPFRATAYEGSGTLGIELGYIDASGQYIDPSGAVLGASPNLSISSWSDTYDVGNAWQLECVRMGRTYDQYGPPDVAVPTGATQLEVRLLSQDAYLDLGGAQLEQHATGSDFSYVDPLATVEYEGSEDGLYYYTPGSTGPFDYWDLNLNQAQEDAPQGFITFADYVDDSDWKLGMGGELGEYYHDGPRDTSDSTDTDPDWPSEYGVGQIAGTGEVDPATTYLVIDGWVRESSGSRTPADDRRWRLWRARRMANEAVINAGTGVPVLGLDYDDVYMGDLLDNPAPDWYGRSKGLELSRRQLLNDHYVAPTGVPVLDPSGTLMQWPYQFTPLGIHPSGHLGIPGPTGLPMHRFGRRYCPYALTTGRSKLLRRGTLRLTQGYPQEHTLQPAELVETKDLSAFPVRDMYRDSSGDVHAVISMDGTGELGFSAQDLHGNPRPRVLINIAAPSGDLSETYKYTDRQGRGYVDYDPVNSLYDTELEFVDRYSGVVVDLDVETAS